MAPVHYTIMISISNKMLIANNTYIVLLWTHYSYYIISSTRMLYTVILYEETWTG